MSRIAVCLSGQPRTLEYTINSILNYFSRDKSRVDFFCHSWNYNTWKYKTSNGIAISKEESVNEAGLSRLIEKFSPIQYRIDSRSVFDDTVQPTVWSSLFYSMMIANSFKKAYEYKHNFRYDIVVKSRFDSIFLPGKKFTPEVSRPMFHTDRVICHPIFGRMPWEYSIINPSDTFFYGDSYGMDIVCDTYRLLGVNQVSGACVDDMFNLGPGTFMYKCSNDVNVYHIPNYNIEPDIIYRKEAAGLDPVSDFQQIKQFHRALYE